MAAPNTVQGDQYISGGLKVNGLIEGPLARTSLVQEVGSVFDYPINLLTIHDEIGRTLPTEGKSTYAVNIPWNASSVDISYWTAGRDVRVVGITARVEITGTDGGAVTATVKKAASATAIASGTALHSGSINLKGTTLTNQTLTLSTTLTDLDIASGTTIGVDFTGTLTSATGVVTIYLADISSDDLMLAGGAFGTGIQYVTTGDVDNQTATKYARGRFIVPQNYVAGQTAQLRIRAGTLTSAVAATSAYVDAEAYLDTGTSTLISGSDIVTTAQQSCNSTTWADYTFDLTATNLAAGTAIDFRIKIASIDAAASAATTFVIPKISFLLATKG